MDLSFFYQILADEQFHYLSRVALAALLVGIVGLERERAAQDAGLRTIMLVGTGACIFTVLSMYAFAVPNMVNDPARIAAQIVVGIGFLGAGALIRQGERVKNLTTAASIWVTAAIGMACGVGWYIFAVGATVITLSILAYLRLIEEKLPFSRKANPMHQHHLIKKSKKKNKELHPQPSLGTSPRMGWLEDAPEKNFQADEPPSPPEKSGT